jgi:hypothetical protein
MGWYGPGYKTRPAELRAEVLEDIRAANATVLASRLTGSSTRLWVVVQPKEKETGEPMDAFIMLYLLNSRQGMIKDMDESMEPYFYDCPTKLFALAPNPTETAQAWRTKCYAYQANRTRRPS